MMKSLSLTLKQQSLKLNTRYEMKLWTIQGKCYSNGIIRKKGRDNQTSWITLLLATFLFSSKKIQLQVKFVGVESYFLIKYLMKLETLT